MSKTFRVNPETFEEAQERNHLNRKRRQAMKDTEKAVNRKRKDALCNGFEELDDLGKDE